MSSEIRKQPFKLPKVFDSWGNKSIINKSRRRNAKQISEKIDQTSSCDWEVLNTLTEDE